MKHFFSAITLLLFSVVVIAHNGENPAAEVQKKRSYILEYQQDYKEAVNREEKIKIIRKQLSTLQSTNLLLKNTLVKENATLRENVSKYDLDYLAVMKNSLKDMQKLLKQLEAAVDE